MPAFNAFFVDAGQEQAVLARLGSAALPESLLSELRGHGIRRLLVIPDGALHYLPFAMLRVSGESGEHYLVEEFATSYVPAMTTLETLRRQSRERAEKRQSERGRLLAFANPDFGTTQVAQAEITTRDRLRGLRHDYYQASGLRWSPLPETEQEAVNVAGLFGEVEQHESATQERPVGDAVVYTGRGACEEQVKRLLEGPGAKQGWQYLLFSTHGLADPQNGMLSCLALSSPTAGDEEDGLLQAQEVLNLQLDTDLVMLSACQTGLGRLRGGEGLVGMSAAFFYAGASSVCASVWSVPSAATRQLVTEFFRQVQEGETDKAEALRQAELAVMRSDERYRDPFYWASFVLMGE